jgi:antitoxin component of MazEF toxin-antitoxin module
LQDGGLAANRRYGISGLDIRGASAMKLQIGRWGNSLAVRLPKAMVARLKLKEGDEIDSSLIEKALEGPTRRRWNGGAMSVETDRRTAPARFLPTTSSTVTSELAARDGPVVTLDTNIAVYALAATPKADAAARALRRCSFLSVQF